MGVEVDAVKLADDDSGDLIVRIHEAVGNRTRLTVATTGRIAEAWRCNLLEEPHSGEEVGDGEGSTGPSDLGVGVGLAEHAMRERTEVGGGSDFEHDGTVGRNQEVGGGRGGERHAEAVAEKDVGILEDAAGPEFARLRITRPVARAETEAIGRGEDVRSDAALKALLRRADGVTPSPSAVAGKDWRMVTLLSCLGLFVLLFVLRARAGRG